jgi:two-component system NtrC family sensor kinase
MVAGVAHEINNPLSFVSNNVAVLQRDVGAIGELLDLYHEAEATIAIRPELLKRIRDFCQRLDLGYTLPNLQDLLSSSRDGLKRIQQIVMDLRDFARLDESDLSEVDINAGIESTVNIIRNRATERQVKIELAPAPLPALSCYPAKINQVVLNLLANAIDASKSGDAVTVRTGATDSHVTIEVTDTGCGIDPSIRDRIFDPFFTTKPPGQGTGLGLSISYGIVQDHGGTIEVGSEVGRGSRFTVSLPRRAAST